MILKAMSNSIPQKFILTDLNGAKVESKCILMYKGPPPLKQFQFIISKSQQDSMLEKSSGVTCNAYSERIKRQSTHLEKIFGNHIYDKGLLTRMCKGHSNLNNKETTIPFFFKKRANKLKRKFTKQIQIENNHMKSFSKLSVIKGIQIQITKYHYALIRKPQIKNSDNTKC